MLLLRQLEEALCLFGIHCEWLLAEDVFPGVEGKHDKVIVSWMGNADIYRIDVLSLVRQYKHKENNQRTGSPTTSS